MSRYGALAIERYLNKITYEEVINMLLRSKIKSMEYELIEFLKAYGNAAGLARMLQVSQTKLWRILNGQGMTLRDYEKIMASPLLN